MIIESLRLCPEFGESKINVIQGLQTLKLNKLNLPLCGVKHRNIVQQFAKVKKFQIDYLL